LNPAQAEMNEQVERTEEKNSSVEVGKTFIQPPVYTEEKVRVEEFKISGDFLVAKVKELLQQGNIRSVIIKNASGRTLVEIPLTVAVVGGVVGAVLLPVVTAIAAIGALAAKLTIVIARKE
jgi:hypothetical protein